MYYCQRCQQPLTFDISLLDCDEKTFQEFDDDVDGSEDTDDKARRGSKGKDIKKDDKKQTSKSKIEKTLGVEATQNKEKDSAPGNDKGSNIEELDHLFELCTSEGEVGHPLCADCSQLVYDELQKTLQAEMKERDALRSYLEKLNENQKTANDKTSKELDKELKKFEDEAEELNKKLTAIEQERANLQNEKKNLQIESERLEQIEERYWEDYNEFQMQLQCYIEDRDAVRQRTQKVTTLLEKLKKTNVYNDTFHILWDASSNSLGTINGLRFGRLSTETVEWSEINAAWGHAVLLLNTIARQLKFEFSEYRLIPMGSFSKIERKSDKAVLELYGSSDISLGKFLWHRRLDAAMVAYLQCLKEVGEYFELKDKTLKLPYKIEKEKIGEFSIKLSFHNDDNWSQAMKNVVKNLKSFISWLAKQPHQ